jgi:mannosylfructose-phosphate synthase
MFTTSPATASADTVPVFDGLNFFPVGATTRARLRARLGFSGPVLLAIDGPAAASQLLQLIDAFGHVARREAAAVLRLAVGSPSPTFAEREQLAFLRRRIAQSPFADRIVLADTPTEAERPNICRAADLFVSVQDTLTGWRHALEAMACGLPAVLPDVPSRLRGLAFGRHALTADASDATDLGVTMLTILRHTRIRDRLARMGAHYARTFLSWSGPGLLGGNDETEDSLLQPAST